jgi:prepilin-type N-terminal cleavage/methylation domain-containing protein
MLANRGKQPKGLSLVETMVAIVVLSIAVLGASGYRYYAALDTRKADMRMTAARVALLLCESWHGLKGDETYDPTVHLGSELSITVADSNDAVPDVPADFTKLGSYGVLMNGVPCYTTMSWRDISAGLRALNVVIAWPSRTIWTDSLDEVLVDSKLFKLTTYTEN